MSWASDNLRARDIAVFAALGVLLILGTAVVLGPSSEAAVRSAGMTASVGGVTTVVGYYFGRAGVERQQQRADEFAGALARAIADYEDAKRRAMALLDAAESPEPAPSRLDQG